MTSEIKALSLRRVCFLVRRPLSDKIRVVLACHRSVDRKFAKTNSENVNVGGLETTHRIVYVSTHKIYIRWDFSQCSLTRQAIYLNRKSHKSPRTIEKRRNRHPVLLATSSSGRSCYELQKRFSIKGHSSGNTLRNRAKKQGMPYSEASAPSQPRPWSWIWQESSRNLTGLTMGDFPLHY